MRYFPDPVSAWFFLGALASVLALATYTDERYVRIPKWLTIPALGLGFGFSCIRGGMLGANGLNTWLFTSPGVALGILDGALFALAGFVLGFFLFFVIWVLGGCGGGDVKLVAALGAWLGPYLVFLVLLVSLLLLFVCLFGVVAVRLGQSKKRGARKVSKRGPTIIRFSLVAALSVMIVALWAFRIDLGLVKPRLPGAVVEVRERGY
jgi:Flp pilus assembly protein protease CpaA